VMLLVTVGPLEAAAIFAALAPNRTSAERARMAVRAVLVAGAVLLVFAFGGMRLLDLLHITLPAFRLAGGFLLLLVAVDLMFVHPSGLTSITSAEAAEAERRDIAVFPLAIPLIAGPGSMAAIVLLMSQNTGLAASALVVATLVGVLLLTLVALMLAGPLTRVFGVTGINVVARVSGVILAALAMQLMMDGLRESHLFGSAQVQN
jgi:multiple antibiotic resistance protein